MQQLYCLLWSGHPLSETILDYLFVKAQEMFLNETRYDIIKETDFEGDIKTELKTASLGNAFGYVFEAHVDWGNKSTHINFIVKKTDLNGEKLTWSWSQVKNMYQFNDN